MLRLFRFLITGDWHLCIWEDVRAHINFEKDGDALPTGYYQVCKCKHCGKYKMFKVSP